MGYYIPNNQSMTAYGAEQVIQPSSYADIPSDKACICAVDNGLFKAYGYIFSQGELDAFTQPSDGRPKEWYYMDKAEAEELCGYN